MGQLEQALKELVNWADLRGIPDGPPWREARQLVDRLHYCQTLAAPAKETADIPPDVLSGYFEVLPTWTAAEILAREG